MSASETSGSAPGPGVGQPDHVAERRAPPARRLISAGTSRAPGRRAQRAEPGDQPAPRRSTTRYVASAERSRSARKRCATTSAAVSGHRRATAKGAARTSTDLARPSLSGQGSGDATRSRVGGVPQSGLTGRRPSRHGRRAVARRRGWPPLSLLRAPVTDAARRRGVPHPPPPTRSRHRPPGSPRCPRRSDAADAGRTADDPLVVVAPRHPAAAAAHRGARRPTWSPAAATAGRRQHVRAVERDPDAVGVVPLSEVGPTVVAARVDGVDPVRDREGATTLVVTGDVMLVRGVPDPAAALAPMRRLLRGADLTVGNLESTLSTRRRAARQGGDSFGGSPALVPVLEDAGFDALSLANNHTGDYGERALRQTVETLQQSRIRPFGAGDDLAEAAAPAVLERRTGRRTPSSASTRSARRRWPPRRARARCRCGCRRAPVRWSRPTWPGSSARSGRRQRQADVVVVLPHWGDAVHPRRPSRSSAPSPAGWSRPAPTWSSAATRTGSRASTPSAACRCCTPSATSSSTWTS